MPLSLGPRFLVGSLAGWLIAASGCKPAMEEVPVEAPPRIGADVWSRQSGAAGRLTALLQPRTVAAELFVPALSDEVKQIGAKLKQAAGLDPRTFLLLVRDGSASGIPTWDARLGITREEFDLLMNGAHLHLKKTGDAAIKLVAVEDARFKLTGLPNLSEASIDTSVQIVTTPYGEVARPEEFTADSGLMGPISGYRWTEPPMAGDLRRYRIHEITLAQSSHDGAAWFIARIADTLDGRLLVDYYARFPGPSEPTPTPTP